MMTIFTHFHDSDTSLVHTSPAQYHPALYVMRCAVLDGIETTFTE